MQSQLKDYGPTGDAAKHNREATMSLQVTSGCHLYLKSDFSVIVFSSELILKTRIKILSI